MSQPKRKQMRVISTGFYIARITARGTSLFYTGDKHFPVGKRWTRRAPLGVVWLSDSSPTHFFNEEEAMHLARQLNLEVPLGDRIIVFQLGIGDITMLASPKPEEWHELHGRRRWEQRVAKRLAQTHSGG